MGIIHWIVASLVVSVAVANLDELPLNQAVLAGSTVTLRCSTPDAPPISRVMWTEFATNAGGAVVSDGKDILSSHPNAARYAITGTALEYNLEITNVEIGDGGTYLCQDINSSPPNVYRGYAELVVLESDPVCQDYETLMGSVFEGNSYTSECEVNYKGNLAPQMTWSGPGEFFTNGSSPGDVVWSFLRFTADRSQESEAFYCVTNFTTVIAEPGHANNTPDYTNSFKTSDIIVSWPPQNLEVTPIKEYYVEGDVLVCTADSKPDSQYFWTNMRTLVTTSGQNFTVTNDLAGFDQSMRCEAQVNIEGSLYTSNIFVNVSVPAITTPTTPPSSTPTTPPPADAPCDDPTGRWSSTNPNAIVCLEMDTKGNLLTLIRNGSDPFFVAGNGKTVYNDHNHIGFTGIWPTGDGVAGFTGECHKCEGVEVILLSGLFRNKAEAPACGESGGTHLTNLYVLTRSGPPCRGMELEVASNVRQEHLDLMGIKAK